ncbi:MAG: phosphatase PAP2 family protein, partial [Eubacterium sp.]|nr:phosphatase PAP2 family protein [Eubacterium sp.]
MEAIERMDFAILDAIQRALRSDLADVLMAGVSFLGGGVLWIAVGIILLFFWKYRSCGIAVLASSLTALVLTEFIIKLIVLRERPYLANPDVALAVSVPLGTSFPSSHTGMSFAGAIPLFKGRRLWGIVGLGFAALVAFSRLYLYVHFPSDVAVGAILGVGIGLGWLFIFNKIGDRRKKPPDST